MPTERIVIVSDVADREVDRVRDRLGPGSYERANGREAVKRTLARHADRARSIPAVERGLDLIGHSNEHHFLTIGSWTIDEKAPCYFEHQLRGLIEQLHITQIRLLGCATAIKRRSWSVIRAIAAALGGQVPVVGTLRLLDDRDYGPAGFIGVDALSPAGTAECQRPPHAQDAIRTRGIAHATRRHGGSSRHDTEHTCSPGRAGRLRRLGSQDRSG